jgi:tRNA A-37 threonylcarbamoyl transferase component Bud32
LVIHTGAGNEMLLRQVTAWWAGETGNMELAQSSRFATVHRGGGHYFKRYHHRDWRDVLKHLIRSSRARRALDAGEQMEALGFHAPRAVCMVEEREGPWVRDSGLVTEEVVDAPNLREWLNRPDLGVVGVPAERRKLLAAAGHEIGRWHRAGLHHGDMRIGNILVRREGDAFVFFWLDNERNARLVPLPMRWRVHNLMQVNMERTGVTKADRLRFWRAYASAAGVAARDARRIQRSVIRYTQSRWRDRGWL